MAMEAYPRNGVFLIGIYKLRKYNINCLPASCAQSTNDVTLELIVDAQLLNLPPASSPKVSYRAFTPQRRAVAQADDSPV